MTQPINPAILAGGAQALQAALKQVQASMPGTPRQFAASAADGTVHTADEALRLFEMFTARISSSDMWPVTAECTREADGTLTVRIIPD